MRLIGGVFAASAVLWGGSALAAPLIYVGSCGGGGPNHVMTIKAAVDAIGANGTVAICPGSYAEQVVIDGKSLSLKGVENTGMSSAVTIVSPQTGLVQNATSVFSSSTYAAQILVHNAVVNISNLVVDGSNNQVPGCGYGLVGILFQNSSGSVKGSTLVNQIQAPGLTGCQAGDALYAQMNTTGTNTVVVSGNYVGNYQKNGITGNGTGLTVTISGNTVVGGGPTNGAAENSIQVGFGAGGTITSNYVSDDIWAPDTISQPYNAASGILVYDSPGVGVSKNVVTSTQFGIAIEGDSSGTSDNASVTGNHVGGTQLFDGIDVCGSSNVMVGTNTVIGSAESGIHIDSSCGTPSTGDTVSSNIINYACAAILVGSGSTPTIGSNTILNATNDVLSPSDVCPMPPPGPTALASTRARRHVSPAR